MVLLEMDMGMCLRYDEDGSLYLKFQGKDESDTLKTIAILKSSKSENATTATAQFLSADIAEDTVPAHSYVGNIFTYKATTSNSSNAHDRLKLTLLFDMKSQSYSAYLSKIADAGATEEIETPTVTAMVENQPFIDNDIKYPSTLRTMAYKGYSQTYIKPVSYTHLDVYKRQDPPYGKRAQSIREGPHR